MSETVKWADCPECGGNGAVLMYGADGAVAVHCRRCASHFETMRKARAYGERSARELVAQGVAEVERGELHDVGSFAQYAENVPEPSAAGEQPCETCGVVEETVGPFFLGGQMRYSHTWKTQCFAALKHELATQSARLREMEGERDRAYTSIDEAVDRITTLTAAHARVLAAVRAVCASEQTDDYELRNAVLAALDLDAPENPRKI